MEQEILLKGDWRHSLLYKEQCFSLYIRLHQKDPFNKYTWMKISDINAKKIYITICYFAHINSTLYKKNNLDKNCLYNGLK
jgi:hypothetical protein